MGTPRAPAPGGADTTVVRFSWSILQRNSCVRRSGVINAANSDELTDLPSVSKALAAKIVAHRERCPARGQGHEPGQARSVHPGHVTGMLRSLRSDTVEIWDIDERQVVFDGGPTAIHISHAGREEGSSPDWMGIGAIMIHPIGPACPGRTERTSGTIPPT